jgi:hypothetical protein
MSGMKAYYLSRAVLSILLGVLAVMTGWDWWIGLLVVALVFGWFLLAPRIGRYAVQPEAGVTALRRDERSQVINDKAARNAFVATALGMGGVLVYCGFTAVSSVPVAALGWLLIFGVGVYYVSDIWLRRVSL